MAIYEVIVQSSYQDQLVQNRFHYISQGTPAAVSGSFGLAFAAGAIDVGGVLPPDTLFDRIRAVQNSEVIYSLFSVINLYDPIDFYSTPLPALTVGTLNSTAKALSPVIALGYRTNRVRRDIRRGTKRFAGQTIDEISDGGGWVPTFFSGRVQNLADIMGDVLEYDDEGNTITYTPAILSKERVEDPETGQVKYRYYATQAEQLDNAATGIVWSPYTTQRTQGSRQFGRGQ